MESIRLDCLSIFNVFMHFFNVLFSKESENINSVFEEKLFKKLFSFEVIIFPVQHSRNSIFM